MDEYMHARAARQKEWEEFLGPYEEVTQALHDEWGKIQQGHKDLQETQQHMMEQNGGFHVQDSDILDINAGGEIVRVTRGTLTQKKGTLLEAIFSGRWENRLQRDSKGCIFLDVNPTCFRCIVDYLNECKIAPPENQPDLPQLDDDNHPILIRLLRAFVCSNSFLGDDHSNILTDPKHVEALAGFLNEDGVEGCLELLYRGTRDGMTAQCFHQKCDNKGPTITIAKTTDGYIFGGYADKAWASACSEYIKSEKAFLFALFCFTGTEPTKFPIKNTKTGSALYHSFADGPGFGEGCDLMLLGSNSSNLGHTYTVPFEWNGNGFTGSYTFSLEEMEVFSIQESPSFVAEQKLKESRPNKILEMLNFDSFPESLRESLRAERAALLGAAAELAALQDTFEKEKLSVEVFCGGDSAEIIFLNVSGRVMAVKQSTLAMYPDSVFHKQFVDPNWNHAALRKPTTTSPREWSADQVVEWIQTIQGLSQDIAAKFRDVPGIELLALRSKHIEDLGINRPGAVALLEQAIDFLRIEEEKCSATFVEHSDYCIGKIIDHMRLKALENLGIGAPRHPEIRESDKKRFKRIVEYYFPAQEEAVDFLG